MTTVSRPLTVAFDHAPVRRFHWRVAFATASGSFADGYVLGVSGLAIATVQQSVELSAIWLGLLGSASMFGSSSELWYVAAWWIDSAAVHSMGR